MSAPRGFRLIGSQAPNVGQPAQPDTAKLACCALRDAPEAASEWQSMACRTAKRQIIKCGPRRYQVRIFDGYDENRKRIYINKQIRGTRKDAQEYLNHALASNDLGALVKQPSMTLGAYLDKWLEFARSRVSRRTGDGYAALLERYIRKPLGKHRLDRLEAMDIQTVYGKMLASKLSARVVRHTHAVLHNALQQAVAWKKISSNPCARPAVVLPKAKKPELTVFSQEDAAQFLATADAMPHGFLFEFALLTGMRPEEYLALQWPDIDFERATAMVQRALVRHKKLWTFEEPKTKGSRRMVSLPVTLVRKLAAHKRAQAEQRLRAGFALARPQVSILQRERNAALDSQHHLSLLPSATRKGEASAHAPV